MDKKTQDGASRRDFLKLAGTTAPLAAVALAGSGQEAEAAQPDLSRETMQDTLHTRAFYDSARF